MSMWEGDQRTVPSGAAVSMNGNGSDIVDAQIVRDEPRDSVRAQLEALGMAYAAFTIATVALMVSLYVYGKRA